MSEIDTSSTKFYEFDLFGKIETFAIKKPTNKQACALFYKFTKFIPGSGTSGKTESIDLCAEIEPLITSHDRQTMMQIWEAKPGLAQAIIAELFVDYLPTIEIVAESLEGITLKVTEGEDEDILQFHRMNRNGYATLSSAMQKPEFAELLSSQARLKIKPESIELHKKMVEAYPFYEILAGSKLLECASVSVNDIKKKR
jgi:hypothetical protein